MIYKNGTHLMYTTWWLCTYAYIHGMITIIKALNISIIFPNFLVFLHVCVGVLKCYYHVRTNMFLTCYQHVTSDVWKDASISKGALLCTIFPPEVAPRVAKLYLLWLILMYSLYFSHGSLKGKKIFFLTHSYLHSHPNRNKDAKN